MTFVYNDGGRKAAGYRGQTGDCVVRAIAIATQTPYAEVYRDLQHTLKAHYGLPGRHASPRHGVPRSVYDPYLRARGWAWTPTMALGSGCRVHLRAEELPAGRLVVRLSGHVAAVLDGVLHDTYEETRGGRRCVYGYWRAA